MIPREYLFKVTLILIVLNVIRAQNSRSYDTNEWVPITDQCPTCFQNNAHHVIEKKATGRVLNIDESNIKRNKFFPDDEPFRSKISNDENNQYYREITSAVENGPQRQELIQEPTEQIAQTLQLNSQEKPSNHQYFRQNTFQLPLNDYQRQAQRPLQQPLLPPQLLPPRLVVSQAQPILAGTQQIGIGHLANVPILQDPAGLNVYQQNFQNVPVNSRPQNIVNIGKTNIYEDLNPGIQAINHGLSGDILTGSNNFKEYKQQSQSSTSAKPETEKETVQLLYVPLESLSQRQQSQFRKQQEIAARLEQQETLIEQERSKLKEQELLKLQSERQVRKEQEQLLKLKREQELIAQQEEALLREQQQIRNRQVTSFQEQTPLPVQFMENSQNQRRTTRPPTKAQTRTSINENELLAHKQQQLLSIQSDFAQQALEALKLQLQLQQGQIPELVPQLPFATTTKTPISKATTKKRKPHQPPLAVYMGANGEVTVTDVLNILKSAKSISVQDTVGPNSPQVFVGPHNLEPPDGYTKFDLPYLSSLETNRIERKIDQLPFFVAPLSYKAPPGYSKIPLPAPHVGSVVVSQKEQLHDKHTREQPSFKLDNYFNEDPYRFQNNPARAIQQAQQLFKLENVLNETPYRIPSRHQTAVNQFVDSLASQATSEAPATTPPDLPSQTINQYELEQINNQFLPRAQDGLAPNSYDTSFILQQPHNHNNHRIIDTTPTLTVKHEQIITELPHTVRTTSRHRLRQSTRSPQRLLSSTQSNVDNNKYTVLEEFSINPRPTSATPSTSIQDYSANLLPQHQQRQQQQQRVPEHASISLDQAAHRLATQNLLATIPQLALQQQPETNSQRLSDLTKESELESAYVQTSQHSLRPTNSPSLDSQLIKQQILNQNELDRHILQQPSQVTRDSTTSTNIPNYYQLDNNGQFVPIQNIGNQQAFVEIGQAFKDSISTPPPTTTKEALSSTLKLIERPSRKRLEENIGSNVHDDLRTKVDGNAQYFSENYRESAEDRTRDAEDYRLPAELPAIHPGIHNLINNLQDSSIRPLLVPASIAPTTEHPPRLSIEQHRPQFLLIPATENEPITTTSAPTTVPTTTTPKIEETTPYRRQRGRQRAKISTTTYAPRRTTQRTRKTTTRRRNDNSRYQHDDGDEYVDYSAVKSTESRTRDGVRHRDNSYATESPRKPPTRQRFRTRGRPNQDLQITERIITTSTSDENVFRQPQLLSGFQASSVNLQPQSYMQFEQLDVSPQTDSEKAQDLTQRYQNVYKAEQPTSTEPPALGNKKVPSEHQKLNVDVLINHPISEITSKEPVIISEPEDGETPYVRFSSNVESNVKLHEDEATTRSSNNQVRIRARGRSRIRTTPKPTTTTISRAKATTAEDEEYEEEEEEEFYGFIRPPSYNSPPSLHYQSKEPEAKLYSATYVASTKKPLKFSNHVHYIDQPPENSDKVQVFSTSTPAIQIENENSKYPLNNLRRDDDVDEVVTTDRTTTEKRYTIRTTKPPHTTARSKTRNRYRSEPKKTHNEQTYTNFYKSAKTPQPEQFPAIPAARPQIHRFRSRGSSHFTLPATTSDDNKSDDEDVEGGNYPVPFIKTREQEAEKPKFQITIEPALDEVQNEDDQVPYSSIYRPKIVPASVSFEIDYTPLKNDIPVERKIVESQERPIALPIISTTEDAPKNDDENDFTTSTIENSNAEDEPTTVSNNLQTSTEKSEPTTTGKPKSRRRGVWRLIKRPVDGFEVAESQFIGHVFANSLGTDEKGENVFRLQDKKTIDLKQPEIATNHDLIETTTAENPEFTTIAPNLSSSTEETFFDSLYKMFGIEGQNYDGKIAKIDDEDDELVTTTEHSEFTTNLNNVNDSIANVSTTKPEENEAMSVKETENVTTPPTTPEPSISSVSSKTFSNIEQIEPWHFGVKTSTSTEISHETEICYRGKCIKSSGTNVPTLQ